MWLYAKNTITPDARTTASPTLQIKTSLDLVIAPVVNLIAMVAVVVVAHCLDYHYPQQHDLFII